MSDIAELSRPQCFLIEINDHGGGSIIEITRRISIRTLGHVVFFHGGSSRAVDALLKAGLITQSRKEPQGRGGKPVPVYDITQDGIHTVAALRKHLKFWDV